MTGSRTGMLSLRALSAPGLSAAQAAALVAGVADELDAQRLRGEPVTLPDDDDILVGGDGGVRFRRVESAATSASEVPALGRLLRRLLELDSSSRPREVPGALMVLMARALGEIDLPCPTLPAFRQALLRVAPDPAATRRELVAAQPVSPPLRAAAPVTAWRQVRPATAFAAGVVLSLFVTWLHNPGTPSPSVPLATSRVSAGTAAAPVPVAPAVMARTRGTDPARSRRTTTRLVLADIDGSDPFSPSFSSDGRSLYFHAGRANGRLMRADLAPDGSIAQVQSLVSDAGSNFHVVPSPDGSAVAFDSDRDGVRAVYTADADGEHARRISGPGFAAVPSWSPDGRYLAFVKADSNPRTWNVWVATVATGELRQVSHHQTGQAWGASWFPDGRRLAYSREDQLVIADLSSGTRTVLRSPRAGHMVRTPSVAPDGDRIVLQVHGDGVWVLDVTRGRFSRILTDRSAEEFHWSPDGRRIAYHARNGRRWAVWTLGAMS